MSAVMSISAWVTLLLSQSPSTRLWFDLSCRYVDEAKKLAAARVDTT